MKNLQGDIIAISNRNGKTVAEYSYDAWGVPTILSDATGIIANVNPYRYRSYYYDAEIAKYYLQSRYYDASVGRFVNGDEAKNATFNSPPLINNPYCYCCDNPVNETDSEGNVIRSIIKKVLVGALKGLLRQLLIDSIEWFFKVCYINEKEPFKFSNPEDYVVSVLSGIIDQFSFSNSISLFLSISLLLAKYLTKFILGRMDKKDWLNLVLDVLKIVIESLVKKSIKKIGKKIDKLKADRKAAKSKSVIKRINRQISNLNLEIKYKGITVKFIIPEVQQLVSSIINVVCR